MEKLRHGGRARGGAWKRCQAERASHQPQRVLVVIGVTRLEARRNNQRADDDAGDAVVLGAIVLIEDDDQQAVAPGLKVSALHQGIDVGLQPGVGDVQPAVVRIVAAVGRDKREVGQGVIGQVGLELGEAREVGLVDVRKVLQRVVANDVASGFLRIVLPGLARDLDLARDVVDRDREAGRSLTVVVGEDLSRGQHKVVADRGMRIGEVLGRQAVLRDERIQVGHAGTAYH